MDVSSYRALVANLAEAEGDIRPEGYRRNDLGNARRLADHLNGRYLFCHELGIWLYWTGQRWARDEEGRILNRCAEVVDLLESEAEHLDGKEGKKLASHARSSGSRRAMQDMEQLARPIERISTETLDGDPYLYTCQNATINLRNGTAREHRRFDYITKIAPLEYNPDAECPRFRTFLAEVMDGSEAMMEYLQRAVGYTLTGDVSEQTLFFCYGTGANGKSTFIETVMRLLGGYSQRAPNAMISSGRGGGSVPNEVARLRGARMAATSEVEQNQRLAESTIKDLTGGDTITARFLHQEFFEFEPTHKLWIQGNHKPQIRGDDEGIWRRVQLIPFTVSVPPSRQDPELPDKLRQELPGILNWAIEGCLEWQKSGLQPPPRVRAATNQYRSDMDVIGRFLRRETVEKNGATVRSRRLYQEYEKWCQRTGHASLSQTKFSPKLEDRGYEKDRDNQGYYWKNLALRSDRRG